MRVDQIAVPANAEITLDLGLQIWEVAESAGSVDVDFLSAPDFSVTQLGLSSRSGPGLLLAPRRIRRCPSAPSQFY